MSTTSGDKTYQGSEEPELSGTDIYFSFGPYSVYSATWRGTPAIELIHADVNRPGGRELNVLAPRYMSYGWVPSSMGPRGNAFSRTSMLMGKASVPPPMGESLPLIDYERFDRLRDAVPSAEIASDVRPLLWGLASIAGWSILQDLDTFERIAPDTALGRDCSSHMGRDPHTRSIFATTGVMLRAKSRPIKDGSHGQVTVYKCIVPGAWLELDDRSLDETPASIFPGQQRFTFHSTRTASRIASLDSDEKRESAPAPSWEAMSRNFESRLQAQIRRRSNMQDRHSDRWSLSCFQKRLLHFQEIIIDSLREVCEGEDPDWHWCLSSVSTLPLK